MSAATSAPSTPLDILSVPSKWIKGYSATNENGRPVFPCSESACGFCLEGAIRRWFYRIGLFDTFFGNQILQRNYTAYVYGNVQEAISMYTGYKMSIPSFNDRPDTTFADVVDVLLLADSIGAFITPTEFLAGVTRSPAIVVE